ncbi:MAG: hypothetical protein CBB68_07880 [Rhodospirillaceae bacterium TMED8]|nr:hypothetical protein [Magnetovibrio sp.]OUT50896.1 MAG: hypothetical protein CBB68_07880 [Rhodospirillaceae bacterium TMED8]
MKVPIYAITFTNRDSNLLLGGHDQFIQVYVAKSGRTRGKLENHAIGGIDFFVSRGGIMLLLVQH